MNIKNNRFHGISILKSYLRASALFLSYKSACLTSTTIPKLKNFTQKLKNSFKLRGDQEYDLLIVDYDPLFMETTEADDDSGWNCSVHPSVFFLLGTLVLTTCATGMLCGAIMTDHWEEVTWNKVQVNDLTNNTVKVQWLLDGKIAKVSRGEENYRTLSFLVPMHGGIWTLCLSLTGK